jgi:hypothetical protein
LHWMLDGLDEAARTGALDALRHTCTKFITAHEIALDAGVTEF